MEINDGNASASADSERLFEEKYAVVGEKTRNHSFLRLSNLDFDSKARFTVKKKKKDVVINCRQDADGNVSCTSLGGDCVGVFSVPPGEQPFSHWVADELVACRSPSQEQLLLVDPNGKIFCSRKLCAEFVFMKSRRQDEDRGTPPGYLRQLAIQRGLMHSNVVRLLDILCTPTRLCRVFEFMEVHLRLFMKNNDLDLPPRVIKSFATDLMSGMTFLHTKGIMHRDLKTYNLYIDTKQVGKRYALKVGGLELSRAVTVPAIAYTHEVVTLWYRPPEILLGCTMYSLPIDMWSIGCCLGEMASGWALFMGDSEIDTIFRIFEMMGTPTEEQWNGLNELPDFKHTFPKWTRKPWSEVPNLSSRLGQAGLELLDGLLQYDPAKRLSAKAALESQYLAD